jgi:hypothetical protein
MAKKSEKKKVKRPQTPPKLDAAVEQYMAAQKYFDCLQLLSISYGANKVSIEEYKDKIKEL